MPVYDPGSLFDSKALNIVRNIEPVYKLEDVCWLQPNQIPKDLQDSATNALKVLMEHLEVELIKHVGAVLAYNDILK
jgi:hypothetical protein